MRLLEDKTLVGLQLVLFLDENTKLKAIDISKLISDKLVAIFPYDPSIINGPINNNPYAMKNLPKILYRTDRYTLSITPQKIDFIFNNKDHKKDYINQLTKIFNTLISIFKDELNLIIHRMGIIINYSVTELNEFEFKINQTPVVSDSTDYHEVNFNWLEKISIDKIPLNKNVRYINNVTKVKNNVISVDMNTLTEVDLNYMNINLSQFIVNIINQVEETI